MADIDDDAYLYGDTAAAEVAAADMANKVEQAEENDDLDDLYGDVKLPGLGESKAADKSEKPAEAGKGGNEEEEESEEESSGDEDSDEDDVKIILNAPTPAAPGDSAAPAGSAAAGQSAKAGFSHPRPVLPAAGRMVRGQQQQTGQYNLPLPPDHDKNKSVFDTNIEDLDEKPWMKSGADITDYFNYGFQEDTWKLYSAKQNQLRLEYNMQSKIKVFDGADDRGRKGGNSRNQRGPPQRGNQAPHQGGFYDNERGRDRERDDRNRDRGGDRSRDRDGRDRRDRDYDRSRDRERDSSSRRGDKRGREESPSDYDRRKRGRN